MPSLPFVLPQPLNLTPLAASGNSAAISLPPRSANMAVTFNIKFTVGSLTNAQFIVQALNPDGTTWQDVVTGAGALVGTAVLTANANQALSVLLPGVKQVRMRYTSTGSTTSSAVVIDATVQQ
jgi:hypothetical protein